MQVGFMLIDMLARYLGIHMEKLQHSAAVGRGRLCDKRVLLAKPMTFMNNSGESVGKLARYYKVRSSAGLAAIVVRLHNIYWLLQGCRHCVLVDLPRGGCCQPSGGMLICLHSPWSYNTSTFTWCMRTWTRPPGWSNCNPKESLYRQGVSGLSGIPAHAGALAEGAGGVR